MARRPNSPSLVSALFCLVAIAVLVGAVSQTASHAQELKASFKRFTYKNPSNNAITRVDITLDQKPGVIKGGQGIGGSDTFKKSTVAGNTLTLTDGSLAAAASDELDMNIGPMVKGQYAIQKVVLTDADGGQITLTAGTKAFKDNVTGFTQDEFYDLTSLGGGLLHIGAGSPGLDVEYTLTNLRVFTNLPLTTFDIDSYTLPAATATALIDLDTWTITPDGLHDLDLPLGPIIPNAYELAAVDSVTVRDLATGAIFVTGPLFFAEAVPGPGSLALIAVGALGLLRGRRRRTGGTR